MQGSAKNRSQHSNRTASCVYAASSYTSDFSSGGLPALACSKMVIQPDKNCPCDRRIHQSVQRANNDLSKALLPRPMKLVLLRHPPVDLSVGALISMRR